MSTSIFDIEVTNTLSNAVKQRNAFPSPTDWRDTWIYFLMIDRFNNDKNPPKDPNWDGSYGYRQGGTFNGITAQLDYIKTLGATAIWITPVLKNAKPDWEYNYHGYGIQDFLQLDERFASDGTTATAEIEFKNLIEQAHKKGLYVILDIVLNHSARVFDYFVDNTTKTSVVDPNLINGPLGCELPIEWLNGFGFPNANWKNQLPNPSNLSADDAVYPTDLQNYEFFRRRGTKINDVPNPFVKGDFDVLRQMVVEYDAQNQPQIRKKYGKYPVLQILSMAYKYLIAKYDVDGFRIDTVKYVDPEMIELFGNTVREYAMSIGKFNFFTFGEIYDAENNIDKFVGRHSQDTNSFGIDAALDYPLFFVLPQVIKQQMGVENLRYMYNNRFATQENLLCTHGDGSKYFVTFIDNHDQNARFLQPGTPESQLTNALLTLFSCQGIPCVYYGTEQMLNGSGSMEAVREALWGKPNAFDQSSTAYQAIQRITNVRDNYPALKYGRMYFREISGNGTDFGHSAGVGGIIAFSRILAECEVLVIINTNDAPFEGYVLIDLDIANSAPSRSLVFSTDEKSSIQKPVVYNSQSNFYDNNQVTHGESYSIQVTLNAREAQVWSN